MKLYLMQKSKRAANVACAYLLRCLNVQWQSTNPKHLSADIQKCAPTTTGSRGTSLRPRHRRQPCRRWYPGPPAAPPVREGPADVAGHKPEFREQGAPKPQTISASYLRMSSCRDIHGKGGGWQPFMSGMEWSADRSVSHEKPRRPRGHRGSFR